MISPIEGRDAAKRMVQAARWYQAGFASRPRFRREAFIAALGEALAECGLSYDQVEDLELAVVRRLEAPHVKLKRAGA